MDQLIWGITGKKPQLTNSSQSSPLSIPQSPQSFTETLSGNIRLEMVKIPAGSFLMGSPDNDKSAYGDEKPQHRVNLQEFYLGKYPITQEQYQAIMGNNPSHSHFKDNPKNPVDNVNWNDAQKFCQKLSEKTGKKYRLPSEAEWEYACRAGTQTCYYFGDNREVLGEYAWYKENSGSKTHPVGQKKPNNWGLCDLHGNVWEWCEDGWHDSYENSPKNGTAWNDNHSQSENRVIRGGSWFNYPRNCRSAFRSCVDLRYDHFSFRVVSPRISSPSFALLPFANLTPP
jgi:formylglycine-generating enzyme required for sulfatase activity